MSTITKVLVAGLATFGAVQALPQSQATYDLSHQSSATATGTPAPAATPSADEQKQLFADLLTAPTAIKRFQRLLAPAGALLSGDALKKLIVFNFNGADPMGAKGGATKAANIETFPILTDLGISTTLGFMEPCGINTPHVHPRATEFLTLVEGANLKFGYILENGFVDAPANPEIAGTLNKFEGTVFPQGSIHFQFNDNCDRAVFVAGLNSADPGTSQVAQNFFNLNADVVNATLGFPKEINGQNIEQFRKTIPPNLAQDVLNCLKKCH